MRIVDLTCPLDRLHKTPQYPTIYAMQRFEHVYTMARDGRYCSLITLTTHTNTHIDAPMHVIEGGATLDQIPLEHLYGEAAVVRIPCGELQEITADDMERHGRHVKAGDIVLVATGWGRYYWPEERKNEQYLAYKQPGLVESAALWLLERKARVVGIDTFAVRHPKRSPAQSAEDAKAGKPRPKEPVHQHLLGNGVIIIEQLTNLHLLPDRCTVGFFPLPLVGFDGSPVRAVAFLDQ